MAEANNMSEAEEEKITKSESFVSVVAVLGADTRETVEKVPETVSYLRERYSDFEIVLVAKKSAESEAENLVQPLLKTVPCIRYLQLTDDGPNDVAREAGDIVITDDNFVSITNAVLYGRTIFSSIRKFITYQLTMNLAAVGVSVLGTMLGIENPVTVIQMLWVNMIMDTLGSLAFAGEPPLADSMKEKPVGRQEPILTRRMLFQMLATGGYAILLSMTFLLSPRVRHFFGGGELYHLTLFFALFVFMGIGIALCTRTERIQLFAHIRENRAFAVIMPAVAAIQLVIVYFGGEIFRCVPLRASDLGLCALFALTVIPADTVRKCVLRIRRERRRARALKR